MVLYCVTNVKSISVQILTSPEIFLPTNASVLIDEGPWRKCVHSSFTTQRRIKRNRHDFPLSLFSLCHVTASRTFYGSAYFDQSQCFVANKAGLI